MIGKPLYLPRTGNFVENIGMKRMGWTRKNVVLGKRRIRIEGGMGEVVKRAIQGKSSFQNVMFFVDYFGFNSKLVLFFKKKIIISLNRNNISK